MTDLSSIAEHVSSLPSDVPTLCRIVQGLVLHPFWAPAYGVPADEVARRDDELQLRPAADIIAKALEIDPRPLDQGRLPQQRVLGNCRDFTTVTVALLRGKGVPARGRCGFGTYFTKGLFEDHWVVEWWNGDGWVLSDAQLDEFQVSSLKLAFDPLDVPRDGFVDACHAWALYRGGIDGERFGLSGIGLNGPWFIRGNIARDVASLNKVELLPWDVWGVDDLTEPMPDEYYDEIAAIGAAARFEDVRSLYEGHDRLHVPDVITAYLPDGPVKVTL